MNVIIFDTETTGLLKSSSTPIEEQPKIIELGALYIKDGIVVSSLTQLLSVGESLPDIITKVTGIKDEDLVGMPTFDEYLQQLIHFFSGSDTLICHNAKFDVGMLTNELKRLECDSFPMPKEVICTVLKYQSMMGRWAKMTALYEKVLGRPLAQTHRALDDCVALYEILVADGFFDVKTEEKEI